MKLPVLSKMAKMTAYNLEFNSYIILTGTCDMKTITFRIK